MKRMLTTFPENFPNYQFNLCLFDINFLFFFCIPMHVSSDLRSPQHIWLKFIGLSNYEVIWKDLDTEYQWLVPLSIASTRTLNGRPIKYVIETIKLYIRIGRLPIFTVLPISDSVGFSIETLFKFYVWAIVSTISWHIYVVDLKRPTVPVNPRSPLHHLPR